VNKPANNRKVAVTIPEPQEEQTRFGHIGLIAALCFALGVSWPFLAGVKLVPNTPSDEAPAGSAGPATSSAAPQAEKSEPSATLMKRPLAPQAPLLHQPPRKPRKANRAQRCPLFREPLRRPLSWRNRS
jgi:hypothetical protein